MTKPPREIQVINGVAYIALTRGHFAIIDEADLPMVVEGSWFASGSFRVYARRKFGGQLLTLHRVLMNATSDLVVDHINGDTLDNRRANLRLATPRQNSLNCKKRRDNRSGYRGVSPFRGGDTFRADIRHGGKKHFLGSFQTAEMASAAYEAAAMVHHGSFLRPIAEAQ